MVALMLGALRDALKEAGASDAAARAAAEEVASYESRLGGIEQQIVGLRADFERQLAELRAYVDQRFTVIEGRLNLLGWMVGTLSAVQIALLLRLLFVH